MLGKKNKQCYFEEKHSIFFIYIVINIIKKTFNVYRLPEKWVEKLKKVKDTFVLLINIK